MIPSFRGAALGAALVAMIALVAACIAEPGGGATEAPATPSAGPTDGAHGCPTSQPPPLAAGESRTVTITTELGTITTRIDGALSPLAAGNFVALAACDYYDGVVFHRVVPGFVNQAGDPFGDPQGTGGPGYTILDEPAVDDYLPGTVAMAKTPQPNSAGSQWFVCIDCSALSPDYAIVGVVTDGMETVTRINALGVADGPPSTPVTITSVEITER